MAKHKTNYSMCQVWGVTSVVVVIVLALTLAYMSVGGVRNSEATSLSFDKDLVGQAGGFMDPNPDYMPNIEMEIKSANDVRLDCLNAVGRKHSLFLANLREFNRLSDISCPAPPGEYSLECECDPEIRRIHKIANEMDQKARELDGDDRWRIEQQECGVQYYELQNQPELVQKVKTDLSTMRVKYFESLAVRQIATADYWGQYNTMFNECVAIKEAGATK